MSYGSRRAGEGDLKFFIREHRIHPTPASEARGPLLSTDSPCVPDFTGFLAQEAQLIGLGGPASMLILLQGVWVSMCMCVQVCEG